jgi:hypothetical protein
LDGWHKGEERGETVQEMRSASQRRIVLKKSMDE